MSITNFPFGSSLITYKTESKYAITHYIFAIRSETKIESTFVIIRENTTYIKEFKRMDPQSITHYILHTTNMQFDPRYVLQDAAISFFSWVSMSSIANCAISNELFTTFKLLQQSKLPRNCI